MNAQIEKYDVPCFSAGEEKEADRGGTEVGSSLAWWRGSEDPTKIFLCAGGGYGRLGALKLTIGEVEVLGLLDSASSCTFIIPELADHLAAEMTRLAEPIRLIVATGEIMNVEMYIKDLKFWVDQVKFFFDFLVADVPFPVILGADWLKRERATWDFRQNRMFL